MTREEALHIAEQIKDYLCSGNPIWDVGMIAEAMDAAIEALKFKGAYEIAVKAANKAFENRWTQWVEWIPCSERLPDEEGYYLVTLGNEDFPDRDVEIVAMMDGDWDWNPVEEVLAWMPLPKPYKEDSK